MRSLAFTVAACAAMLAGCGTSYSWRPQVPAEKRTVTVPTFANETDVTELGAVAARQILREIQREGTFRIATGDDAALEVQGVLKKLTVDGVDVEGCIVPVAGDGNTHKVEVLLG